MYPITPVGGRWCLNIRLNERQKKIIEIVKERGPITGSNIAQELNLTRAALRPDLSILPVREFWKPAPVLAITILGIKDRVSLLRPSKIFG